MSVQGDLKSLPGHLRERLAESGALQAWDVSAAANGARAVAVGADGVFVIADAPEGDVVAPWGDVEQFWFPTQFQVEVEVRGRLPIRMVLQRLRHRNEMLESIPPPHRERLSQAAPASSQASDAPSAKTSFCTAPPRSESADAIATLWLLTALGAGMQLIGGLIVGASRGSTSVYGEGGSLDPGSTGGLVLGWVLSGAGVMVLLVAVIGFGIILGTRAARPGPH